MNINLSKEELEEIIEYIELSVSAKFRPHCVLLKKLYGYLDVVEIVDRPSDKIKKILEGLHEDKPPRNT
jgi:hypothetical protein